MGKRGPARMPIEVLKARGSTLVKERTQTPSPIAERKAPPCPTWLTPEAVTIWDELIPILDQMGVLTVADGATINRYCSTLAEWIKHNAEVQTNGGWYDTPHGQKCAHPAVRLRSECAKILKECEDRLGLSPSARSSLNVTIAWMPGTKPQQPAPTPTSGDKPPTTPAAPIDGERFFKRT